MTLMATRGCCGQTGSPASHADGSLPRSCPLARSETAVVDGVEGKSVRCSQIPVDGRCCWREAPSAAPTASCNLLINSRGDGSRVIPRLLNMTRNRNH